MRRKQGILIQDNFEVTPTDPSVVPPSGYDFAVKGEAFYSKI
jgi:hypothetical protein